MVVKSVLALRDFNFWSGGREKANYFSYSQLDEIEKIIIEIYPNGIEDMKLNELFWFNDDSVANWLGYADFGELMQSSCPFDEDG